jgi:hypothetical protein
MDPVSVLFDLSCCLLEFVDVASIIVDFIAWRRSEPYREARKDSKRSGQPQPPSDFWFQLFVFLTPITITLTAIVIYKWLR